jgi:hypothetical protein
LAFQRDGRNVEADAHIDPLLSQRRPEVVVGQVVDGQAVVQQTFLGLWFQNPGSAAILVHLAKSYGEIGGPVQLGEERGTEDSFARFGVIECLLGDRHVRLLVIRPSVVEKPAIQ